MNGKLSTEFVVEACFIMLLIAAACVAAGFGGVVRSAVVLFIFATAAVLNIIRLVRAVIFRRAVKTGNVIFRDAVIKAGFRPTGVKSYNRTAHAFAVFDDGGETRVTHMIGTCDETLRTGDRARIMLNSRDKSMFALEEKQVRGAVAAYAFYTAICVLFSAALAVCFVLMR
ncbi:MAG: hypothetical protein K2J77_02165 [Oscillospiraceae bacterium]|nr:hypothetical protein [Oscillospiraceae bacterium]